MCNRYLTVLPLILLGLALLVSPGREAQAQATKIGFTDHEVIIASMPDYANIQRQLQQEYLGAQEALQSLAADFQESVEEYQVQQRLLTEERRAQREQELQEKQTELQEAANRKDEDLAQLEAQLMEPIFTRVQEAIDEVAKSHELDIVLRHRVGAQPVILYINPDTVKDITLEVAVKLGIDVDQEGNVTTPANIQN